MRTIEHAAGPDAANDVGTTDHQRQCIRGRDEQGRYTSVAGYTPRRRKRAPVGTTRGRDEHGRFVRIALDPALDHVPSSPRTPIPSIRPRIEHSRVRRHHATVPPEPTRNWTALGVRNRAHLGLLNERTPGFGLTKRAEAHLDRDVDRLHHWITGLESEYAVIYSGAAPSTEHVEELIRAAEGTIDRGAAADTPGVLQQPDICIDDDDSNPLVTRAWQHLVLDGAHAVTVGSHTTVNVNTSRRKRVAGTGPSFVVRTDTLHRPKPIPPKKAYRRPSWWAAFIAVAWFAIWQIARITTTPVGSSVSRSEERWVEAIRRGSVSDLRGAPLPGSSLWPSMARPLIEIAGVAGVRWLALLFSLVAILTSAAAASRLFGRWAARTTAIIVTIGLFVTGVSTSVTPTALSMAALGVGMLAIALVEGHDRRSWILLAGIASTVAIVASYQSIVFVAVLTMVFTLLRGKHGLTDSNTYRLVVAAGLLAWFLPTRVDSVRFITASRSDIKWTSLFVETLWLAGAAFALTTVAMLWVKNDLVRKRVRVLSVSLLAIPLAQLIAGATEASFDEIAMAFILVAPAAGGAITYQIAKIRYGSDITPQVRSKPEVLVVDPATGRIRHRLVRYANRQIRAAAAAVVIAALWYLPWALFNVDWNNWWIAVPFLLANTAMVGSSLLSAYNNWHRAIPIPVDVARGHEPLVGIIVPTYSEPLHMVVNTVQSIIAQDWPVERLRIVVSDDAHSDQVRNAFETFASKLPDGVLLYNRPPKRGDPERKGDSKSGNLNSAVKLLADCDFVETRDADDLVGSTNFLRATVSQLMDDPGLGYIQTIKETKTSPNDPFNNNEPFFYRGTMLARNADYAIFPCGSGLVWRREALDSIDGFPVWNLVEDLHSGVLGLRAGWRGLYVPIVGAFAQHSPEDIANIFKQRGTWALDTVRLLVFDRFKGIPRKTRLHFVEQATFYLLSFPLLTLIVVPAFGLFFDRFPLDTDATTYAIHFWGFALAVELVLLAMAANQPAGSLWKSRLSWIGMAPVYAKSSIRAVWYGRNKKPAYKVTRKTDEYQVYIKMVKTHYVLLLGTFAAIVVALLRDNFLTELDLGSLYWGIVAMVGLGAFLRLSWFGVDLRQRFEEKLRRPIVWANTYWWPALQPLVLWLLQPLWRPAIDSRALVARCTTRLRRLNTKHVQSEHDDR